MDPSTLAALIGGGSVNLVIWGTVLIFFLKDRRQRERLVDRRVVRDSHLSPMFGNVISDWERVWTWKPVHTLDNGWVIWRFVWRRRVVKKAFLDGPQTFWFQYLVKLQYVYD